MKDILYVDCTRGIASDMLVAALMDCLDDKEQVLRDLQLNIDNNMVLSADCANSYERRGLVFKAVDSSFSACEQHPHHAHSTLKDVHGFIDATKFSDSIKSSAKGVYDIIASAEAEVHCADVESVHFHEVGQKRAIACIVCACALMERLSPDSIVFSGINTGFGKVLCAHGEVDVPAPATKVILKGIPNFCTHALGGELCTPTGVALAKFFADSFIPQSGLDAFESGIVSSASRIGVGLGLRDIGVANGVKAFLVNS